MSYMTVEWTLYCAHCDAEQIIEIEPEESDNGQPSFADHEMIARASEKGWRLFSKLIDRHGAIMKWHFDCPACGSRYR